MDGWTTCDFTLLFSVCFFFVFFLFCFFFFVFFFSIFLFVFFYIIFFYIIPVISGRWEEDDIKLSAMELLLDLYMYFMYQVRRRQLVCAFFFFFFCFFLGGGVEGRDGKPTSRL